MKTSIYGVTGLVVVLIGALSIWDGSNAVDYSTQVKPILNKHCIACHGGVKKQGEFSVLFEEEALAKNKSGHAAIIPGDAKNSEFIKRLTATDPDERMPYKEAPLSPEDIELLTKWVDQGAKWGDHWAYQAPDLPSVPGRSMFASVTDWFSHRWEQNDIDYFITDKLNKEQLKPAAPADKATLLRRVALDLTGLPPTEQQYKTFLANPSAETYATIVDELLASPAYGERWAAVWLDLARYGDSKGYEKDNRLWNQWHFRDYLIKAFNADMPYDRFTKELLAGDLLPNPTEDQYFATIFHRNTPTNDEGGTDDDEFRSVAVMDRVNTTMEVWQGTTIACVQCHSHPYDPFRHEDYYKLMAFFNNTADEDLRTEHPTYHLWRTPEKAQINALKSWVRTNATAAHEKKLTDFLRFAQPTFFYHDYKEVTDAASAPVADLMVLKPGTGTVMLPQVVLTGKRELYLMYFTMLLRTTLDVHLDSQQGPLLTRIPLDTCAFYHEKLAHVTLPATATGRHDLYFTLNSPGQPFPGAKGADANFITEKDAGLSWLLLHEGLPGRDKPGCAAQMALFQSLLTAGFDGVPVTIDLPAEYARKTYLFERGNWAVKGKEVKADVPASLHHQAVSPFVKDLPKNRLGLATWLTSKDNPLTARTAVNRLWEQLFGIGLVETLEDFGTQGMTPSHPELLDYLAVKFRDTYGWSQKKILKEIVLSATYQQDSRATRAVLERDPYNRLLARGPRFRLTAEQVRDQALAISGLLSHKLLGPSVMPFQPEGVWQVPYNADKWQLSSGEDQYRRAVYTFQKRSTPYPSLMTFDGSNRGTCLSRRIRTNTPLQALVTLNDPVYAEASRHYAQQMMRLATTPDEQIRRGYQLAMGRSLPASRLSVLQTLYRQSLASYRANTAETAKLLQSPAGKPELAALTTVASALLNTDEFTTKE
ncbi:DUF1553 domain-containing protein [Fibrella aquatilis]|uniref:DUF1553 domain-containing protein n=1 Tax=Fibrella aquatilis TaxID=2817059 RepID=A0A939K018_9BACT|nr:DUF1553 domain-containing protein [Fibrella aquatilis]MBO0932003.1 DUF1553 domain-containing protein [Fibrella aquatilis]